MKRLVSLSAGNKQAQTPFQAFTHTHFHLNCFPQPNAEILIFISEFAQTFAFIKIQSYKLCSNLFPRSKLSDMPSDPSSSFSSSSQPVSQLHSETLKLFLNPLMSVKLLLKAKLSFCSNFDCYHTQTLFKPVSVFNLLSSKQT